MPRRATSPTTPLDRALDQAAAAAPDAATRTWLHHLLENGDAAEGVIGSTTQPAAPMRAKAPRQS